MSDDCPHNSDPALCMACLLTPAPPAYTMSPEGVMVPVPQDHFPDAGKMVVPPQIFDFAQYSPEWWACRRGVISASNFHRFAPVWPARLNKDGAPHAGDLREKRAAMLDYACKLVGDLYDDHYGQHEDYQSAAMKNGVIMEPHVRRWYEFAADCEVRQVGYIRTADGLVGCSPDGLIGEDGGLELKSPAHSTHIGYLLDGVLPAEYRAQVHAGLIVTGRKWWDFVSYVDGLPPLRVRVFPDEYTERLRQSLASMVSTLLMVREKITGMMPKPEPDDVAKVIAEQTDRMF